MHGELRHRRLERSGTVLIVVLTLITAGCAVAPADRESLKYERMDAQIRADERLKSFQHACSAAGGVVILQRDWGRIKPKAENMQIARCDTTTRNSIW